MSPAIVATVALVALSGGFIVGYLVTKARQLAAFERLGVDQRTSVGLYLRRKVAETGVESDVPQTCTTCEEVLAANAVMAGALLEHDRRQVEMGDTQDFGLASTMRLESTDDGPMPAALPKRPSSSGPTE